MKPLILEFQRNSLWQRIFRTRAEDTLPHTVTHQRIYIVPSRRGFAFLITLLLMLVTSINYALSLGYALCFLLTGLFSVSLLHTYRNLAGLRVSDIKSHHVFAGEKVDFQVTLLNVHSRTRHGIRVSAGSHSALVKIPQNEQTDATITISTDSRGICRLGKITLQSNWPVGLWNGWSYLHVAKQALVFPNPEADAPPLPHQSDSDEGAPRHGAATGDVSGLRDYQPGDSIGSIAWKSAARGLGLQSRTFDHEDARVSTILDLQHVALPGLEAQLSRLCAWVLQAENTQTEYALRLPGLSLDKSRGKEQQALALKALALFGETPDNVA